MRRTVTADPAARVILSINRFADLVGVDKGTARSWVARGLPCRQPLGQSRGVRVLLLDEALDWIRSRPRIRREYQ